MPLISILIDTENGNQTEWNTEGLSGIETLGVMADTIFDMYDQLFDSADRPFFEGGESRVCIEYDGENVSIAYRPEANIVKAQGLTMAALTALCKRSKAQGFNPLEGILGAIMSPVNTTSTYISGMEVQNGGALN